MVFTKQEPQRNQSRQTQNKPGCQNVVRERAVQRTNQIDSHQETRVRSRRRTSGSESTVERIGCSYQDVVAEHT